ncbi:MAG: N-acetyl-gamma-glutamyl-phosphate reductase [Limisphaerales bacterium]
MTPPVKAAIVGASGYSGEELARLLLGHPQVELTAVTSRQYAGQTLATVFPKHAGQPRSRILRFTEPKTDVIAKAAQVVFLALPHGVAAEFAGPLLDQGCKVIDLSADFRLKSKAVYREFYGNEHPAPALLKESVYGLPEWHRADIKKARLIASPGCYPTSILLPLLPLLKAGLIRSSGMIADSLSGVSGAGRKVDLQYLFPECNESMRPYGIPKHRHLSEIEEQLTLAAGHPVVMQFSPHLIPVNRGLLTTLYLTPKKFFLPPAMFAENPTDEELVTRLKEDGIIIAQRTVRKYRSIGSASDKEMAAFQEQVAQCFQKAYGSEPFVRLLEGEALPDTKNVTGTNMIEIAWRLDARTGRLIVMSAIDNITKGASGQAVQSMNILCGFPETTGLI